MKPYFIKDDDGNYLNPIYLFDIFTVRVSNVGSFFVFTAIKSAKTFGNLESIKNMDTYEVQEWIKNFLQVFQNFKRIGNTFNCENEELYVFEKSELINTEIHTSLDIDKISHINSIYENDIFQYFEIVYIDSDQVTIKKFESDELAETWIATHFEVI